MSEDQWLTYKPMIDDRADNYHVMWIEDGPAGLVGGITVTGEAKFWKSTLREWRDFCRTAETFGNYPVKREAVKP